MVFISLYAGWMASAKASDVSGLQQLPDSSEADTHDSVRLPEVQRQQNVLGTDQSSYLPESYILGTDDQVAISMAIVNEYNGAYRVLADGTLNLPLVGSVKVAGLTMRQATDEISSRYRRYIHNPAINLDLVVARPIRIAIAGEINRPGTYTVQPSDQGIPNVTEAIQLAGGITQLSDIRNVQVYREQPGNFVNKADRKQINIDLWQLITTGAITEDIELQDGDTLFIPAAPSLNEDEAIIMAEASFSPDTITVNVVGEVQTPGVVEVKPNTPLNQAILVAGGFNTRAYTDSVDLIRLNPNGTVDKQEVIVDFSENISNSSNPSLRNNDTIVVRPSGRTEVLDDINPFLNPLGAILNIFNLIF